MNDLKTKMTISATTMVAILVLIWANPMLGTVSSTPNSPVSSEKARSYIVQGSDMATVSEKVRQVGGEITHELNIINAVGTNLTNTQQQTLKDLDGIKRIYENRQVKSSTAVDELYCDALSHSSSYEFISRVQLGNIDHSSGASNYSCHTYETTELTVGTGVTITVTLDTDWSSDIGGLWIDWNQDGDFDDADETITTAWSGLGPYSATVTPPAHALLGETRMRTRIQDRGYTPTLTSCGDSAYGEVEDYAVVVTDTAVEYPAAAAYSCDYEYITGVSVGDINMESGPTTYSNFTSQSTEMTGGEGYDIVVSLYSVWASDIGGLWIDWNQDGDFDDFDEEITIDWLGTGPYMTTIYPPVDAVLGTTRMRVRIQDSDTRPYLQPYDTMGYGEVEDYSIMVVEDTGDSGSGDDGGTGSGGTGEFTFDYFPQIVDAHLLHDDGNTGQYATVAIIDTGCWIHPDLMYDRSGDLRIAGAYDATNGCYYDAKCYDYWFSYYQGMGYTEYLNDGCGHGSHIASVILNSSTNADGAPLGTAPSARIFPVKAFDENGTGSYLDVIEGIQFVVNYRHYFGIKVLNLSFSAEPISYYWDDPLNQAVMAAWQAGITVVVAAGNDGPDPMTIGVPGNVPYVITVGAASDNFTSEVFTDETVCSFSSCGPTVEGFVKPEVVAPGGHMMGLMPPDSLIAQVFPEFTIDGTDYFVMTGTSQAAAVVSGAVAMILTQAPHLTPDEVKGRLMASAKPAVENDGSGAPGYSVFQQGAGLINAYEAIHGSGFFSANEGMNVGYDLSGQQHYGGMANCTEDGVYYVMGMEDAGTMWDSNSSWSSGYMWSDGLAGSAGYMWSDGLAFSSGYMWSDHYAFGSGYMWSDGLSETMSINSWVWQE